LNSSFSQDLLDWYDLHGRKDLPWQQNITPYHVWLSEIMLQQTQVATVIDYYQRFIEQYPSVEQLAAAPLDDVLALWTGLGYYARARNLHKTAKIIVEQHYAQLPDDLESLIALPGIGRSTAGAIMSLGHHRRYPILDGNVKRVLCRYRAIEGWPGKKEIEQSLWALAEELLPQDRFSNYIQAQMDLGATVCTRAKPRCSLCPLQKSCLAYGMSQMTEFPHRKPKKPQPLKQVHWLVARSDSGAILLEQRPNKGIWGGLWSFPEFTDLISLKQFYQSEFDDSHPSFIAENTIRHVFTHYKLDISPFLVQCSISDQLPQTHQSWHWYEKDNALRLGLPAPVKAYISTLE